MIPKAHITQWRSKVSWPEDFQIEQDLILTRIIIEIFKDRMLQENLAFRGGTALNKLFFSKPLRYSEDIDLVQINPGPIGDTVNRIKMLIASKFLAITYLLR